ncbi:MAG: beta-N-acetylhexosaminidase [Trueperaceae bacterium]
MGQLMVSFLGLTPPDWVLEGVSNGDIAAVCLFDYNVSSPAQLREATSALHEAARLGGQHPPLIGIDQEGGQLMAVTGGATELPGNMALGATRSEELAEQAGQVLGLELLALGCNLDFAPVLDLAGHLSSAVVGTRAYGDDPKLVASLGVATIRGLQGAGVLATAKHFPGHGDTELDSHHEAPVVTRNRAHLELLELVPFRAAIAAGVKAIMSAHVRYPAIDDAPATLSRALLTDLLRGELHYSGLTITDAMDMRAVADGPAEVRVGQALEAGADLVLLGHLPEQQELLKRFATRYRRPSLERIERARSELPPELPDFGTIGRREHRELAQAIAERAVTVVRGAGSLPLVISSDELLGLVVVEAGDLSPADTSSGVELQFARQVRERHAHLNMTTLPYGAGRGRLSDVLRALDGCSTILVGTVNAIEDPAQRGLLEHLHGAGKKIVHLALRSPADLTVGPPEAPCLCTYGIRPANTEAAVRILFGEIEASGVLPVKLPGSETRPLARS